MQKFQYLRNILCKDAQQFFLDRVEVFVTNFDQAVDMIGREYNSPVRQTRVNNYLNSVRVLDLVPKKLEVFVALSKVYRQILQLSRRVPPSHHGDAHRIEFIRQVVIGYPWAHKPLFRVATHELTFQQLFGELEAALQLHTEAQIVSLRVEAARGALNQSGKDAPINYSGQGKYRKSSKPILIKSSQPFTPLSISSYFNCGGPPFVERLQKLT